MKFKYCKSTLYWLIFVSFISLGFCGEKRDRDDAESSTARDNKSPRYQTDLASSLQTSSNRRSEDAIAYKKLSLLNIIEWIDKFELECSPRKLTELLKFKDEIPEAKITKYLKSCDEQSKRWLDEKIKRLGGIGEMIQRWFNFIAFFLPGDLDLMIGENVRLVDKFKIRFQSTWQRHQPDRQGIESTENSRRAYYLGDGICVHMLASPLNKIEESMEMVLRHFGNLQYVKYFRDPLTAVVPTGITIYAFQKICRRFREIPLLERNPLKGVSVAGGFSEMFAKKAFETNLGDIKANIEDDGYNCEWSTLFNHKLLYHFLDVLREKGEIGELRKIADDATDALVWHCMSALGSAEEEFKIFDTIRGKSDEHLFPALIELLSKKFKSYTLKPDQSINDALDIRAPNSGFRKSLMTEITKLLTDSNSNVRLANYFLDLLFGHLNLFQKKIFKRPDYKQEIVAFELPEFLFHVFSIKGYRPKFPSSLFDFYYLQTVAEICNMIPVDISKIMSSRLAAKRQNSDQASASTSTPVVEHIQQLSENQKDALVKISQINFFDAVCNLEALLELSNFNYEAENSFFIICDSQARGWLEKKIRRIDSFGLLMERWMNNMVNIIKKTHYDIGSMMGENFADEERLLGKIQSSAKSYRATADEIEIYRRATNYGDGICIHLLSPPFDRVENFMETTLNPFGHLKNIRNIERTRIKLTIVRIYIFQKVCRKFQLRQQKEYLKDEIIQPPHPIDGLEVALENFNNIVNSIKFKEQHGLSCDGAAVFNRKQGYRVLNLLQNSFSYNTFKLNYDKSMNHYVGECLSKFDNEGTGRVFAKTMSTSTQAVLPTLLDTLSKAIESYQLPPNQSINKALDIRSPKNGFKQLLITQIKEKIVQSSNKELAKLLTDLLQGYFQDEIFSNTIYENKQLVEYKLIEFLFQVFDIEGYKPQVSSPLLDVYYLYKISEICDMIPVDELSLN